ncbi:hypothetical protein R3P38DRAFT_3188510 [Favolaschia claudopus]|uniref:Uncharacterized protein n=1 Tax=Favolaschia claudopus TaxID=2862362 RepID=A0AAW0BQR5_9AGAR
MADEEDIPWTRQLLLLESNASSKRKKCPRQHFREVSEFLDGKEKHRTSPADEEDNDSSVSGSSDSEADEEDTDSSVSGSCDSEADSRAESLVSFLPRKPKLIPCVSFRIQETSTTTFPKVPAFERVSVFAEPCRPTTRNRDTHVDPEVLERSATRLLARFKLRFSDVRLLLTAARCAIVGPSIISLARPEPCDVPYRTGHNGIWLAYPELLKEALVITTPAAYPIESGFARRFSVWSALRKYVEVGFPVHLNEYPRAHVCGENVNCPATLRSSDDEGCRFFPFSRNGDTRVNQAYQTRRVGQCGGSGCSEGILRRDSAPVNLAVSSERTAWLRQLRRTFRRM